MINLYNNNSDIHANQSIYDNFNNFIFSEDRSVFNKFVSKVEFYLNTHHLNGDIVECGVFKGSGLSVWLKLLEMYEPNSIKKVIGFDFFNPSFVDDIEDEIDRETMHQVFDRCSKLDKHELSFSGVEKKLLAAKIENSRFDLVAGDIIETSAEFLKERPGFRISILNLDLDLDDPTYYTLHNFWDNIVDGGIVIFDEYAYHNWSEANGVDRFVKEMGLTLHRTFVKSPTAFIIKE